MSDLLQDPTTLALAVFGAVLVGMSKGGLPGTGAVTLWIYASIFGAKESVAILVPVLICADLYAVAVYRNHMLWPLLRRLAPSLLLGTVLGAALYQVIPASEFEHVIGILILMLVVMNFVPKPGRSSDEDAPRPEHPLFGPGLSFISGACSMLANAGSPIAAYYLISRSLPKLNFLGTYAFLILLSNVASLPLHWAIGSLSVEMLPYSFGLGALSFVGVLAARWIVDFIPQRQYEIFIWVIITLAGVELILA